ncbi:PepSY domain-containing protein [Shewanella marisflavi]|uniref:PepSY domain-containing protein n=1 Tax=Shewanella TaxID=22 RepID=UPI003AAD30F7
MARWLISLMLLSGVAGANVALANPAVLELLSDSQSLTPQKMIEQAEKTYPGVISEFQIDVENGQLIYELSMINTKEDAITEFEFWAKDGRLIRQKVEGLEADDKDELKAVKLLKEMDQSFSQLLKLAMGGSGAHILEAQLDHDLGISYLELKLIDANGKHRIAFDIENQRPLPLLKWD